ncbi:MAG: fatty acid desaturase [Anaerolineae bacterium]|nr:fatty acid desaturase [Anaerolineae bacterium]
MTVTTNQRTTQTEKPAWQQAVRHYQHSDTWTSVWQIFNSVVPYFVLWYLAYRSLEVSYLLTLGIALFAGLFGMRIFIIFHDCGHGSFFKSRRANNIVGVITGIITFTPYYAWRQAHAVHHATAGDLDRRGTGDIWTLTYDEYKTLSRWKQISYRLYRNPFIIFVIGPVIDFVILQRLPWVCASDKPRDKNSVAWTNLALLTIAIVMSLLIGWKEYLLVQIPIIAMASSIGVWLFYVQHQYENTYWEHHEDWDFATAALYGSSYFKLPKVLQWFSGNIGFHHIHHLSPRIPNYKLENCHNENEIFQVQPLTLRASIQSMRIRVWDEDRHKMIGYYKPGEEHGEEHTEEALYPLEPNLGA